MLRSKYILATTLAFALAACSPTPQPIAQQQEQAPVQYQQDSDDGLSTTEALLLGAGAGAVAGHLAGKSSSKSHSNSGYYHKPAPTVIHKKTVIVKKYYNKPSYKSSRSKRR